MSTQLASKTTGILMGRVSSGSAAPEMDVPLARGGHWRLSEQAPDNFTLIVVFRGVHCSFCRPEVEKLQTLRRELSDLGIEAFAVSMDDEDRARRMNHQWALSDLSVGYGLSLEQARAWGLFVSRKVKEVEPDVFSEPGCFLIRPDGTLYAQFQSTAPWMRLDLDVLVRGVQIAMQRGTPPRGGD
ncbi:MAG: redoxin domain-containing protein [Pseudomonadota bacterium]